MGGWYSMDLRERVVAAYEKGGVTEAEVAAVFSVGEASVRRWRRCKRETGSVAPRPRSGGMPPAVHEDEHDLLRAIVAEMPHLTNTELTEEFRSRTGRVDVSRSAIGRTVLALELTRKKDTDRHRAQEPRIQQLREWFKVHQPELEFEKLVFIDEAGSQIGMVPLYARSPKGERAHDWIPRNRGTVTTMIGALDCNGIRGMMTVEGATDTFVFEAFVDEVLVPKLNPGDVVVLDNLGAHRPEHIRARIEAAGARVLFLPPYSPEFNPIEHAWSTLKGLLRTLGARTQADLDWAITQAINAITPSDALGWFRHCGYLGQSL